jgi:Sigma-54 interaction domain
MRRLYPVLEKVAPADSTVLILGETGTGKVLVARAIHDASPRAKNSFVVVACGSIAENLIESELFGHVRGAFSGAHADRRRLFEEASGGTLFLDEIGELPAALQPRPVRVLQPHEVRSVRGEREPLGHPDLGGDQAPPRAERERRHLPRRPLLSARGRRDRAPSASRPAGRSRSSRMRSTGATPAR